jgi:LCP family protein required for cell wall assembly
MTITPHYRANGRQRAIPARAHARQTVPGGATQRPYHQSQTRRSGRAYVESRLVQARPATPVATGGGYQPTMAIDFSTALVPSARTLREEMESLRWEERAAEPAAQPKRSRKRVAAFGGGTGGGGRSGPPAPPSADGNDAPPPVPKPWVLRHKKLVGFLATFSVILLVFGIYVAPVLIAGTRAYREVFVDSGPRPTAPAIAITNAQLTPVTAQQAANDPEPTPTELPEWNGTDPVTLLLLGVDRREDEAARSDTIILIRIDPVENTAAMLSIPRDTKVVIPGHGIQKINAAYAFGDASETIQGGGPSLVMTTIEANFGIRIDYFAEVDFEGFQKIIDIVGGVTIDNPYAIKDDEYPADGNNYQRIYFPAGWQHLDGEEALIYARTRHDDGDAARNERQQQVLLALREQALGLDLISKSTELLTELAGAFHTDLSPTQLIELSRVGQRIDAADISSFSLMPALTEQASPIYYLVPDWNAVAAILSDFAGETIAPPASALANPDYSTPIVLRNSSGIDGMATRVADVLEEQGFTNVTVDYSWSGEWTSRTTIADRSGDLATSMFLAGAIGVQIDSILLEGVDEVAFSSSDWQQPGVVSIDIGGDAPDPTWYDADAVLEELFADRGLEITTPEPTQSAATATPPIDYTLPATGDRSPDEDHGGIGDQTGGPAEAMPTAAPSPTPTP